MKKRFFENAHMDPVKKGEVEASAGLFYAVRFGLGREKYVEHKTERAAVAFMKREGYTEMFPEMKRRKSRAQINKIKRKTVLKGIRLWFLEREEFLNVAALSKSIRISPARFDAWLKGRRVEFNEREYKKIKEMRDFIKGMK